MKGYGQYIKDAREREGRTQEWLGKKLDRSDSTVDRIEAEQSEPSIEQINTLVASLPISAEVLLEKMGLTVLTPQDAAKLPRSLVQGLLDLTEFQLGIVQMQVQGFLQSGGGPPK